MVYMKYGIAKSAQTREQDVTIGLAGVLRRLYVFSASITHLRYVP